MKKIGVVFVILILVGLLGWQIYKRASAPRQALPNHENRPAVAVETAPVQTGVIRQLGVYTGSLKPSAQFVIAPRITGRLKRLLVNIGDKVERDQVVVQLIDEEYRLRVEQARAAVEITRAQLAEAGSEYELAKREFERASSLSGKAIVAQSELDVKQARLKGAAAKLAVAKAELSSKLAALKEAEVHLSYTQIRASWRDGSDTRVVGQRFVDEGALLAANAPVATILDLNPIVGVIHVIERDYPKIEIGQPVQVTADALPDKRFSGRIVRLSPILNEASRQALVELEIANPELTLKPGMFIRVEIEFARKPEARIVPITALVKRGGQEGVFVLRPESETVRFVSLTTGIQEGDLIEVLAPPLEGRVVTLGHHMLEDGAKVRLSGRDAANTAAAAGRGPDEGGPAQKAKRSPESSQP